MEKRPDNVTALNCIWFGYGLSIKIWHITIATVSLY